MYPESFCPTFGVHSVSTKRGIVVLKKEKISGLLEGKPLKVFNSRVAKIPKYQFLSENKDIADLIRWYRFVHTEGSLGSVAFFTVPHSNHLFNTTVAEPVIGYEVP